MANSKSLIRNIIGLVILLFLHMILSEFTEYYISFGPILISFLFMPLALSAVYLKPMYAVFFGLIYGIRLFIQDNTFRDKNLIGAIFLFIVSYVLLVAILSLIYRVLVKGNISSPLCSGIVFGLTRIILSLLQTGIVMPIFFPKIASGSSFSLYMFVSWGIPEMIAFFIIGFLMSYILNKFKRFHLNNNAG